MLDTLKEEMVTRFGKLFGLELKVPEKDKKKEREIGSPVIRIKDDGAAEIVTASGGVFYQSYSDVAQSITTERDLVLQFRKMSTCPEIHSAIEEIVNDAIVYPRSGKYPVKLDLQFTELSASIKNKIVDAFDYILFLLQFDRKAHIWFRNWYIDGRLPFYILPYEGGERPFGKTKRGIKNLIYIDPLDIKKIRELEMEPSEDDVQVEIVKDINEFYLYFASPNMDRNFIGHEVISTYIDGNNLSGIRFQPDSIVYATSGYQDDCGNVLSYLYNAMKAANQLNSLEESMLIYRLSRAPSRRVFYVDVGNLPTSKAEQYLTSLIARYKNRVAYDSEKGKISSDAIQKAMVEDYWLPRREGGKGTEISTIQGSESFHSVTDELEYFKYKLYTALYVPISRLDSQNTFTFGKTGEITRNEVKFSKFINHLRRRFASELFNQLLRTECIMEKIVSPKEWNEILEPNIQYIFDEDSYFTELKELDVLASRTALLQSITDFVPTYFSQEFVKKNVLFQTDEEIAELERQRKREKEDAEEADEIYNDVSGDKKLSVDLGTFRQGDMVPSGAEIGTSSNYKPKGMPKSAFSHTSSPKSNNTPATSSMKSTTVSFSHEG